MKMKLRKLIPWIPSLLVLLAGIVTVIVVAATGKPAGVTDYLSVGAGALFCLLLTFLNERFRLRISLFTLSVVCAHVFLSVDCGTALGAYGYFGWWDLFVHGLFGLVCCGLFVGLYMRFYGERPNLFGLVSFLLMTVGLAALWEVYEFTADLFLHSDMQGVEAAIAAGLNPLTDTITDIAIAMAGVVAFYAIYLPDAKYWGGRLYGTPSMPVSDKADADPNL